MSAAPKLDEMELSRPAQLRRPKWNPKRWHPVYEEVVMMDCMGYRNIEIARLKGLTVQHISNIITSEKGKILREYIVQKQRAHIEDTFEARVEALNEKSLKRMTEVLDNDEYAEKNPGGIFDRSLRLLQATKKVAKTDDQTTNVIMIPAAAMAQMTDALKASDAVRDRHQLVPNVEVNTLR